VIVSATGRSGRALEGGVYEDIRLLGLLEGEQGFGGATCSMCKSPHVPERESPWSSGPSSDSSSASWPVLITPPEVLCNVVPAYATSVPPSRSENDEVLVTPLHWCVRWRESFFLTTQPGRRRVRSRSRGYRGPRGPRPSGKRQRNVRIRLRRASRAVSNHPSVAAGVGAGMEREAPEKIKRRSGLGNAKLSALLRRLFYSFSEHVGVGSLFCGSLPTKEPHLLRSRRNRPRSLLPCL
jgi:hypothetical protein